MQASGQSAANLIIKAGVVKRGASARGRRKGWCKEMIGGKLTGSGGSKKRDKLRVAVLFGGCSSEYQVSLKSAYAILCAMDKSKYEIVKVGITRDGRWLRFMGDETAVKEDTWSEDEGCVPAFFSPSRQFRGLMEIRGGRVKTVPVDVVFPVLHGKNGEDGTLQGLLELAEIPYVGCGLFASAVGMDKDASHKLAEAAGVAVAKSAVFHRRDDGAAISQRVWNFQYPLFVKPANGGSSIGITKVEDTTTLLAAVGKAFEYDSKIVIEENVPGFEVGCAVLGTENPVLGEVDELQLHGSVFDYTEKYNMTRTIHHVPARIDSETASRVKEAAMAVYRALECRGIARIDFFLTPEGKVVFNEINTLPGFTTGSRYPKMLMAAGLDFEYIIDRLICDAAELKISASLSSEASARPVEKKKKEVKKQGLVKTAMAGI